MENYSNVNYFNKYFPRVFVILLTTGVVATAAFAYDQNSTHPALSDEIVQYYNSTYSVDNSFPLIVPSQASWIHKGSVEEDAAPRWINHFYDPIHNKGWDGAHYGKFSKEYGY